MIHSKTIFFKIMLIACLTFWFPLIGDAQILDDLKEKAMEAIEEKAAEKSEEIKEAVIEKAEDVYKNRKVRKVKENDPEEEEEEKKDSKKFEKGVDEKPRKVRSNLDTFLLIPTIMPVRINPVERFYNKCNTYPCFV